MAQSNSEDSGLFSILSDLFVDKPRPQPASQSKAPPQPKPQPASQSQPPPQPPPQPASKSGPAARRQDELVKKFPGSKIIRHSYNPHSTLFPSSVCDLYMERFYEAAQDYTMGFDRWYYRKLYARSVVLKLNTTDSNFGGPEQEI